MAPEDPLAHILVKEYSNLGIISLNRPQALNALSHQMIQVITQALKGWASDNSIKAILLKSTCKRAFCAGGDLKGIYKAMASRNLEFLETYFRDEYNLTCLIESYSKPFISFIDGIIMGGGVGLAIHGSHRLITQKTLFAMPETALGYFPDIGASSFLNKMPVHLGLYVGLSGNHLNAADTIFLKAATHLVEDFELETIENRLYELENYDKEPIEQALNPSLKTPSLSQLPKLQQSLSRLDLGDSLKSYIDSIRKSSDPLLKDYYETLQSRCPLSLAITYESFHRGQTLKTFKEIMQMEFNLSQNLIQSADFREGIKAAVISRDRSPKFKTYDDKELTDLECWFKNAPVPYKIPGKQGDIQQEVMGKGKQAA